MLEYLFLHNVILNSFILRLFVCFFFAARLQENSANNVSFREHNYRLLLVESALR